MISKVKDMFLLQQKLNDETNGSGWEQGYTKSGNMINWKRCIYMECAELVDSFSWKHWKDLSKPTDWDNVKVEIIDIWHFILSLGLEHYKSENIGDLKKLVTDVSESIYFQDFTKKANNIEYADSKEIINIIEHIIHLSTANSFSLFYKLLDDYFMLAIHCGINLDELHKFYMAKNVLNKFRQDNGYKDGSYSKTWNGKEDNEVMLEIVNEVEEVNLETLYQNLEMKYRALSSN